MSLLITTSPTVEPVSLSEAKEHLKIESSFTLDDSFISALIVAARQMAENYTDRKFIDTTITEYYDKFPSFNYPIPLYFPDVTAINNVKYIDANGTEQTFNPLKYKLDQASNPCRIGVKDNGFYPSTAQEINSMYVEYTTGFGATAADVPEAIKTAIKLLLTEFYENRGNRVRKMPTAAGFILNQYTIHQH